MHILNNDSCYFTGPICMHVGYVHAYVSSKPVSIVAMLYNTYICTYSLVD